MPATETATPPQIGQLAHVRGRRFVAVDVRAVAPDTPNARHLVKLASVDDFLGDELAVVWEMEPGAEAVDFDALPQPVAFDDAETLDAFLNAVRWGIVNDIERGSYLAPFRSGIKIEDYQLDPLVRALQVPRANLLLADGVGLGKTIEAGLVVQEFVHRNRVQRVLILCPSSLQLQWQEEMRDKFGLEFRIVDHATVRDLRRRQGIHANPWAHYPRLITSYDFMKQDHVLRVFRDLLPADGRPTYPRRFGLLVVDECHNVAPGGRGLRNSQRTQLVRTIGPHFEHKLFLSATPHNGFSESFTALLELLDNQRYARGLPINKDQLHGVTMVRRLKSDDGLKERFCERRLIPIEVDYSESERKAHALLQEYTRSRRAQVSAGDAVAVEFVLKTLKKRFFSSPAAFRRTLETHLRSVSTQPQPKQSTKRPSGVLARLLQQAEDAEAGLSDEANDSDSLVEQAVEAASQQEQQVTPEQLGMLNELLVWAKQAETQPDTRLNILLEWLAQNLRPNGKWNDERVILFTEARDTQRWLWNQLALRGFAQEGRMEEMYGGMPLPDRERVKAAFLADPRLSRVRILLATDTASEGTNLHRHCNKLIHWETSWRPTVMEQRNGRVDRHGQPRDVDIYHFAPVSYRRATGKPRDELDDDLEFLFVAAQKTSQIREDLGKVGPVIADQVISRMLGKRAALDTSTAEAESSKLRRLLKAELDYAAQVQRLRAEFDASRQAMNISPENIRKVVEVGLRLAGQPPLIPETHAEVGTVYRVPALTGAWTECLRGLEHPFTREQRPLVFDPAQADGRDDVVLAHLNHRLVTMCLGLLRAEVWERDQRKLARITVKSAPKSLLDGPAVVVHGRLLVLGQTQQRLHEELIAAGGKLVSSTGEKERWVRFREGELRDLLAAARPGSRSDRLLANLKLIWDRLEPTLRRTLEARLKERTETLESRLAEKRDREKAVIERVLNDLRAQLEEGLEKPDQLELDFGEDRADYSNLLRHRIQQIPEEIAREHAVLDRQYTEPDARLFPVCVTIILPSEGAAA